MSFFRLMAMGLVLTLCLSVTACTGDPAAAGSTLPPSSSKAESSSTAALLPEYDADGWAIIENIRLNRGLSVRDDHSACFYEDVPGYIVEGNPHPFRLDADTLRRVVQTPCRGDGSIQWRDFNAYITNTPDQFDGIIPVSKLKDPIFLSMNLPSEALTLRRERTSPQGMAAYPADANRVLPIGAIYPNDKLTLDDSDTFTVCLGRINLALRTKDKGWYLADDHRFPTSPDRLYYLPWELEHTIGNAALPAERIAERSDHVEVTLTGADLNGGDARGKGAIGAVLHFWGAFAYVKGNDALGVVASYVAWVKEPDAVGKLVATIGADWYTPSGKIMQAFSGYNHLLQTNPRTLIGHTVGPKAYDSVMDTETVQTLIGLK